MKKLIPLLMGALFLLAMQSETVAQGVTTASLNGIVSDLTGETLPGTNVVAVHIPSSTSYGTTTRADGKYNLPNLRVGGPYSITVSFVGYEPRQTTGIYLTLGQDLQLNFALKEKTIDLQEVTVVGDVNNILNPDRAGTETSINAEAIAALPTVDRDINDFLRMTPQASITSENGISIAGTNNRFNSIFIDGAVNNDVFGLSSTGTNGGQTGISPISIDAIEQFQVVVAPYDVRQGGFAGGGINAVTRSGSNNVEGSVYWFTKNEGFVGKTPTDDETVERTQVDPFSSNVYGLRVGGPIVKDKLFFFVNAEIQRDETPQPYDFNDYEGDATQSDIDALRDKLMELGYDPGTIGNTAVTLDGEKFLGKIDWNINKVHKLSVRHSYTKARQEEPQFSGAFTAYFSNSGIFFPSTTNSSAIELKSLFSNEVANDLILGFTSVSDNRDPLGDPFPYIDIEDGSGSIQIGSEQFSTANLLDQQIFTITDNLNLYKGDHTITIGTHNEFYSIRNVFIRQNFGSYQYSSLADFMNDSVAEQFDRSYSLVDNITGDETGAAADFNAMQLGLYVQDKWTLSNKFNLTAGLRIDIPMFTDDPVEDTYFNETTIPMIQAFYGEDALKGARAGQMPGAQIMLAPRVGFNYSFDEERKTQLRGGIGIFTSRVPFVWPGGAYNNNGLSVGGTRQFGVPFIADAFNQPTAADFGGMDAIPGGQMDLFAEDFKYPQVFRTSLAVDRDLPWGLTGTLEGLYSKTLNNVFYYNLNLKPSARNLTGGPDDRPIFDRGDEIDPTYTRILLADNTSEGYTYNVTAALTKAPVNGFSAMIAYTFGRAYAVFEGTSSQNSSQWRGVHSVDGRNFAPLGRSDFDMASRVIANISYTKDYADHFATTVTLFYNGQSGSPYSYIYNDGGNLNNEDSRERNLIWIPASMDQVNLIDYVDGGGNTVTAQQQWNELDAFIANDDYLSENRGGYAEKNMSRTPFEHVLDLRLAQDFYIVSGGVKHSLQVTLDIFNFTNLLNKDWGRQNLTNFGNYELIDFAGFELDGSTPTFNYTGASDDNAWFVNDFPSRWRMQLGLRYTFM